MKKSTTFVSLLAILALALGLTVSGCSQKSDEEKAADELTGQSADIAKDAEKAAKDLKADAEKAAADAAKAHKH